MSINVDAESSLREAIMSCTRDPLKFVLMAYAWGEPNGPLSHMKGPDKWQIEHLRDIGERLRKNPHTTIREAIAAAHGVGKSADACWLIQWGLSTCVDARAIASAGTLDQMRSKLIPEYSFWHEKLICRHWFRMRTESVVSVAPGHEKTWRADFLAWNESRPEAFAGAHTRKRMIFVLDEASQIPQSIFDVVEGALSDAGAERIFSIRSNTTRASGAFYDAFHRHKARWINRHVDGRDSALTDKEQIAEWEQAFGEDSDFFRVRVAASWPRIGDMAFFNAEHIDQAMRRDPVAHMWQPLVMGADIARFGDDSSVLAFRRGQDAASVPWRTFKGLDTMQMADEIAAAIDQERVDVCFIDEGGVGAGVLDRLRQLHRHNVVGVNFGSAPSGQRAHIDGAAPFNRRAEMYAMVRAALPHLALPDDSVLEAEMNATQCGYRGADDRLLIESKADLKRRGEPSPDRLDALALTYAAPVAARSSDTHLLRQARREDLSRYNPYSSEAARDG